jgi:mono/diheme cytochrome c family protein
VLLASLSAAQKAGLGGMGVAFIVFALVSAILIPRYQPNFPGRLVWLYVAVSGCFFVGMMSAVIFVARETETEASAERPSPSETTPTETAPKPPPVPQGDAAAGKALFAAQGCGSCHTFAPANSTGTVGPDLDELSSAAQAANRGSLGQYTFESIKDPNAYVVPGFSAGVMPPFGTTLTDAQIADLVAFLTAGSGSS